MKPTLLTIIKTAFSGLALLALTAQAQDPRLLSSAAVVSDATTLSPVYSKNATTAMPIASMTKLMTAMIFLDSNPNMEETVTITEADVDTYKHSSSRVPVGARFTKEELLHLALMSSENRAAHALARTYPGGVNEFVVQMNFKSRTLQLHAAHFTDPTGLLSSNVASPQDVARMAQAAYLYPKIREFTSDREGTFSIFGRDVVFRNTNGLVRGNKWDIDLSKTGFIEEAGRCMVIRTSVNDKSFIMVLMDSASSSARESDAKRIRAWLEGDTYVEPQPVARTHRVSHRARAGHSKAKAATKAVQAHKKPSKKKHTRNT